MLTRLRSAAPGDVEFPLACSLQFVWSSFTVQFGLCYKMHLSVMEKEQVQGELLSDEELLPCTVLPGEGFWCQAFFAAYW